MNIKFTVFCRPQPQGSIRAFTPKGWNRPVLTSDNKDLKSYRQQVSIVALAAMRDLGMEPIPAKQAVSLTAKFYFQRPKSKKKDAAMTVRPDLDKIVRSTFDALTGIVFGDDSQVTELTATKIYGVPERVEIEASTIELP